MNSSEPKKNPAPDTQVPPTQPGAGNPEHKQQGGEIPAGQQPASQPKA